MKIVGYLEKNPEKIPSRVPLLERAYSFLKEKKLEEFSYNYTNSTEFLNFKGSVRKLEDKIKGVLSRGLVMKCDKLAKESPKEFEEALEFRKQLKSIGAMVESLDKNKN
jgi:hypothetical protein